MKKFTWSIVRRNRKNQSRSVEKVFENVLLNSERLSFVLIFLCRKESDAAAPSRRSDESASHFPVATARFTLPNTAESARTVVAALPSALLPRRSSLRAKTASNSKSAWWWSGRASAGDSARNRTTTSSAFTARWEETRGTSEERLTTSTTWFGATSPDYSHAAEAAKEHWREGGARRGNIWRDNVDDALTESGRLLARGAVLFGRSAKSTVKKSAMEPLRDDVFFQRQPSWLKWNFKDSCASSTYLSCGPSNVIRLPM